MGEGPRTAKAQSCMPVDMRNTVLFKTFGSNFACAAGVIFKHASCLTRHFVSIYTRSASMLRGGWQRAHLRVAVFVTAFHGSTREAHHVEQRGHVHLRRRAVALRRRRWRPRPWSAHVHARRNAQGEGSWEQAVGNDVRRMPELPRAPSHLSAQSARGGWVEGKGRACHWPRTAARWRR